MSKIKKNRFHPATYLWIDRVIDQRVLLPERDEQRCADYLMQEALAMAKLYQATTRRVRISQHDKGYRTIINEHYFVCPLT